MYHAIVAVAVVAHVVFGAWAARWIAAQRPGTSLTVWTIVGAITGWAAPLFAWNFAGWRSGQSGLQMLRRGRRQ